MEAVEVTGIHFEELTALFFSYVVKSASRKCESPFMFYDQAQY